MSNEPAKHETFSIERTYSASIARVWAAWSDPVAKRRWFAGGEGWFVESHEVDLREGGREGGRFRYQDGPWVENHTIYMDVVPERRFVCAYAMIVDGKRISVSLGTTEFFPAGKGTRLVYTEQATFFEGGDGVEGRRAGCEALLVALDAELKRGQ